MGKDSSTTNNHKKNNKNDLILVHLGAGNHSIKYKSQYEKLATKACRYGMKVLRNAKDSTSTTKVADNQNENNAKIYANLKLNDASSASINLPRSTMQALAITSQIIEQSPLTNTSVGLSLSFGGEVRNDASVILVADGKSKTKRKRVKRTSQLVLESKDRDQNHDHNRAQNSFCGTNNSISGHSKVSLFDDGSDKASYKPDDSKVQTQTQSQRQRCYFGLTNITNFRHPISRCLNFALAKELFPRGEKLGVTKCCFLVDNGMRFDGGGDDNRDGEDEDGCGINHKRLEKPVIFDDGYCEDNANLRTKNAVRQHQYWDTARLRLISASQQKQGTYKNNYLENIGEMKDATDNEKQLVQEKEKETEGKEVQEAENRLSQFQPERETKGAAIAIENTSIEVGNNTGSAIISAAQAVTDTIGVLIQDRHQNIAMGVSSGGNLMKPDGRVGCACVSGAGSYTMRSEEMNLFEEIIKPRLESQRRQHRLMIKRKKQQEKEVKRTAMGNEKLRKKRKFDYNDDENGARNNNCKGYEDNELEPPIIYKISMFATGNGEAILQADLARHCCQYMLDFLHLASIGHGQKNFDEQYFSYGAMLSNALRKAVGEVNGYVGVVGTVQQRVFYGTHNDDDDDDDENNNNNNNNNNDYHSDEDGDGDGDYSTTVVWAHTTEALVFGVSRGGRHPEVVFSRNADTSIEAATFKMAHGEMHT